MNNVAKKEKTTPAAEEQTQQTEQTQTAEPTEAQKLQQALDAANDKFLRLAAEYDNYRKRTAREKEELNGVCKSAVVAELLPVIDNLDRALANKTDNFDDYKKGVEMIGTQFYAVLDKLGIESFGATGDAFDPNLHNAVMHIEDESLGENVVAAVFSKGYRMGDRVIRPATVQVAN
ncbi:MAG: nucleotide exchange factor GrpE [Clostridia bacterium]|nr:nucleotide exchange factor GrpE [Clostridia bacterium]